jgi:hypothetical protein
MRAWRGHPRYQYYTAHLLISTPSRSGAALCCLLRLGRGPAAGNPPPTPAAALWSGGHPAARLGPAQGGAYGYRGMRPAAPVPGPALFRGRSACGPPGRWPPAPLSPTRRPPRRPARAPGVRGSRSLRARVAVPSTVDALPLCPLLPGWPPGGRSAPGSRAPGRRGSPRRSRRRRSGPGGPRGAAAATGRLGRRCRPARAPGPLFLCSCCGFRARRGARGQKCGKWCKIGRKTAKTGKNSCKNCTPTI